MRNLPDNNGASRVNEPCKVSVQFTPEHDGKHSPLLPGTTIIHESGTGIQK